MKIRDLTVNQNSLDSGATFEVSGNFGGNGATVTSGQELYIDFQMEDTKINFPNLPLDFEFGGEKVGEIVSYGTRVKLVFNQNAVKYQDIEGHFSFLVNAEHTGPAGSPNNGSITIVTDTERESVTVKPIPNSGHSTQTVYYKSGQQLDSDLNKIEWFFNVNSAKYPINTFDANPFIIYDELDETMDWDSEYNYSNGVVLLEGKNEPNPFKELTIREARDYGIHINFEGKKLKIEIDPTIENGAVATIDETLITFIFRSIITDEVMLNEKIKSVNNNSQIDFDFPNDNWKVKESEKSAKVNINRDGNWISGAKKGSLKIFKIVEGKKKGIPGVTFEIKRLDGKDIIINQENHGDKFEKTTDDEGIINIHGLPVGDYSIKEVFAPEWIQFNEYDPLIQHFEITENNLLELEIENSKKLIDFKVQKNWLGIDGEEINDRVIKVQLYRNDEAYGDSVEITNSFTWTGLEFADDFGEEYIYSVKEVGEHSGKITIDESEFKVDYQENDQEVVITNQLTQEKLEISGEKTWNDFNDKLGYRPESIEINLLADGEIIDKQVVTEADDWKWSFTDLDKYSEDKEIEYTISETAIEHYSSEIDGYDVINVVTPGKTSVQVTKTWEMVHGNTPESITVKLLANGEVTDKELILTEADGWVGTFKGLPMYDDELEKIEYSVEEVEVEGFEIEIDGDMDSGFVVTNTYSPKEEPVKPPVVNPEKPPRTPEVASVNRPKPEELPVTGSSSIVMYTAIAMVGFGLFLLIKERKEHY